MRKSKKRYVATGVSILLCSLWLSGCGIDSSTTAKERDLEFTVVAERDIPSTLKDVIEEKKMQPLQISYTAGEDLYIAVGYGEQLTGGYSISVNELYETAESIVIDTTLVGPENLNQSSSSPSYPYVVVKTEVIADKQIEFN